MEDVRAIKAKRLAGNILIRSNPNKARYADKLEGAEDQQLQRFIFLHFHDYRQYPSDCEIVKNYLATWHPDTSSSRVSLRISRLRLRSSLLAFRQKSHYPVCSLHLIPKFNDTDINQKSFASELVATTTIPFLKTQVRSLLLASLNMKLTRHRLNTRTCSIGSIRSWRKALPVHGGYQLSKREYARTLSTRPRRSKLVIEDLIRAPYRCFAISSTKAKLTLTCCTP